jgi:hypothetical protein
VLILDCNCATQYVPCRNATRKAGVSVSMNRESRTSDRALQPKVVSLHSPGGLCLPSYSPFWQLELATTYMMFVHTKAVLKTAGGYPVSYDSKSDRA